MPNPFDQFDAPQAVTVPLGPAKPKDAPEGYRWSDATHTHLEPIPGGPHDPASKGDSLGDEALTGEEFLKTVPAQYRNMVKLYAANKLIPPARPSDTTQKIISAAMQYDQDYDPALAKPRQKAIQDFSGRGSGSLVVQSVNRLASHLSDMWDASEKMGGPNLGLRPLNKLIASVEQQGEPELVAKFDAAKPFVATELDKIMKGTGQTTVSGIQEAVGALDRARSLDERRAAFKQIASLVHGALDPVKQGWDSAYGGTRAPPMWVSPKAAAVFGKIDPENAGTFGGDDWRGLPGLKGAGDQPTSPPPSGGGGAPPSDQVSLATGDTQTSQQRGPVENKLAAMLASRTPSANIRAYAKANDFPSGKVESVLAWRAMNPKYRGPYDVSTEVIRPTNAWNRAAASPLAAGAASAADAALAGFGDEAVGAVNALRTGEPLSDAIRSADFSKQMLMNANPKSALAGSVLGGIGGMAAGGAGLKALGIGKAGWLAANPIKAAALGDTAYGTAFGAGENNDNRLLGAGVGMLTAPIASFAGQGALKAGGKLLTGVVNPAVDRLRAAGIPLTVGEVLGGGWKKAQDAMTSVFGPGNMVSRRYNDGRRALNEAAFNQAGQEIGAPVNAVGQRGIDVLDQAKSLAYSDALDPVTLDLNTPHFQGMREALNDAATSIPDVKDARNLALSGLETYIDSPAPAGVMRGRDFQEGYRGLSRLAKQPDTQPYGHEIGQVATGGKLSLAAALQAQNPGAYEAFLKANSANRHLNILANAVNAAKSQVSDSGEQLFTPAQLGTAATANAKKYGSNISAAGGNRPFNQLALDAQQIMSSKLPESGTAPRLAMLAGLSALGGGTGYGTSGGEGAVEGAAIPAAALTLLGTRRGQQLLTAALLKRVAPFRIAGRAAIRNPQVGGDILTAAGIPLLTGQ
jgi:hypothetical protein